MQLGMSALGQKRTFAAQFVASVGGKAGDPYERRHAQAVVRNRRSRRDTEGKQHAVRAPQRFLGPAFPTALAALIALMLVPVGAHATGGTLTVYAGGSPYNVSAAARRPRTAPASAGPSERSPPRVAARVLPHGTLMVNQCLANAYCLPLASNVTVVGQGRLATTIKVADGEHAASFAVFGQSFGRTLENVQHASGSTASRPPRRRPANARDQGRRRQQARQQSPAQDLYVRANPGDAFQDMGNSAHVIVNNVVFKDNGRNGVTMDPAQHTQQ